MWPILAALISSIIGFGAGLFGTSYTQYSPPGTVVSPTPYFRACYHPQPDIKITLKWPDNFRNLTDNRVTLNPDLFQGKVPYKFNSLTDLDADGVYECKKSLMNSNTPDSLVPSLTRTFIQVRTDLRIASCKTDEYAGPYAVGLCPGIEEDPNGFNASRHRGQCFWKENWYSDLRKIAEANINGELKEIFWNPYSYNVGCNYEQDKNCGPADGTNVNLKDFLYVLNKRDAFDPNSNAGCPALWDAGSTNDNACSHFFDVYLAEDIYLASKDAPPTTDPDDPFYFIKNILENCQEQSNFTPIPDSILDIPPSFIRHPFLPASLGSSPQPDKINPQNQTQRTNYNYYVWSKPKIIKPDTTNLVKITEDARPLNICTPNSPKNNCYDPLGTIEFRDENGKAVSFRVYSQITAPQTFLLVQTNQTNKSHVYMITEKDLPQTGRHDPTLQLKSMEFISQNQWTWATPWCKPAIYLYPEKETELNVKLTLDGQLTESLPLYDKENGWQIIASPDGTLQTTNDQYYPYLYYEADIKGINIPKNGWVWKEGEINSRLSPILSKIGFNQQEIEDFMNYWLPKLKYKPYYFATLIESDQINQKEKLDFSVTPDTLIRVRVVFEGLVAPLSVNPPPKIDSFTRRGFTVTDWGGTIIGKSCSEVEMK
ncbi:hypothetical protein A2W14_04145 [Candidatus Gottesmanbacteria bacterium RBG_16_37_8]|uniref:Uncharacterized protein n=1 Tax=Candidatus Gottesmanbacteria bacterium RBG_16_37_8 TaxID=1798371 RepID=A0A1F5YPG5_9BACT|nr:MAG: hypothetical protein A2W14_04145 [Candidatus Gottesmanbacteria bacterium RBG_16_37_8]